MNFGAALRVGGCFETPPAPRDGSLTSGDTLVSNQNGGSRLRRGGLAPPAPPSPVEPRVRRDPMDLKWWQTKTFWTSLAGAVVAVGGLVASVTGQEQWAVAAVAVAAFIGNAGSIVARGGAVDAVKQSPQVPLRSEVVRIADQAVVDSKAVELRETGSVTVGGGSLGRVEP